MTRFAVSRTPADDFDEVGVYHVRSGAVSVPVWVSRRAARCGHCSGPLTAMSASCAHARAVMRHIKKQDKS